MASSHPNHGRPVFCLPLDGWPTRTIFGNLSSFIHRTCLSHFKLSPIVVLETGIEPHFSHSLLFEIRSVNWIPRATRRQFLRRTSSKSSSVLSCAHYSGKYLTTVITLASNILILVCRLIFLFFQTFLGITIFLIFLYIFFCISISV